MGMFEALNSRISDLQDGMQPDVLKFWHHAILRDAKARAPPWLQDRISIAQDAHLPMRFNLDISRRAIKYYMMAVDAHLPMMPPSTRLYFLRFCEAVSEENDKSLV